MKRRIFLLMLCLCLVMSALPACGTDTPTPPAESPEERPDQTPDETPGQTPDETPGQTPDEPETPEDPPEETPDKTPDAPPEEEENMAFYFKDTVSQEVLCNYLSRAVTISLENSFVPTMTNSFHVRDFILNTGAKYICRFATCWSPSLADYDTHAGQKAFINSLHQKDPDVVFEACVFECISEQVNEIPIPDWVFKAFGMTPEARSFSFSAMCFPDGSFKNQWGVGTSVPDITRTETMLFLYYRACRYIQLGYEALHMGQIHLIGRDDKDWENWTTLLSMIREFAYENARRGFVFINAHTHGIVGTDGVLLFDFHMYPSRPMADGSQDAHFPTEDDPQRATFQPGHSDSIYGKSLGGVTYSGWECESLPYLVELDNYGDDASSLHVPKPNDMRTWGMDEITWYANQPDWYRAEFLEYAYEWVMNEAPGDGFFAMPGQRVARIYDENNNVLVWQYYAYNPQNHKNGCGDEAVIKEIWASYEK